ncbi:hypothetical protein [Anaerococcus degeneri]|uniref:Peptidase C39-like domain-containing protein n=1 Tax=Anaerococcus degeneri TaxID=361500 RepID=A0ABS7Z0B1_9FIRM|nr:hypothetical protein [Anaerococcus degeneri]MBP2016388.1 hypothetical protein [Anaerococcus degeneri]MCA2096764.1 hypothetical protein [Anaerococcus degeneri]
MKLTKSRDFVPVMRDNEKFYGGHQEWLKYQGLSKFFRDRSCVVTAFTNSFFYLYKYGPVDFETYNKTQYEFYKRIRPKANGVPTAKSLLRRIDIINHALGLNLSYRILEGNLIKRLSLGQMISFINEGLAKDTPVILINWLSRDIDITSHHGLCITELNEKDGRHEVVVSSWGRRHTFYLEDFYKQARTYTGLIYFTK